MNRRILPLLLLPMALCWLSVGCSDEIEEHDMGTLRIAATIDPSTPKVGQNTMHITVHDLDQQPVLTATVSVDPQMPAHGHGSNEVPVLKSLGAGSYDAFPVTFTMPGTWEVTVHASTADDHGMGVFEYQVE